MHCPNVLEYNLYDNESHVLLDLRMPGPRWPQLWKIPMPFPWMKAFW